MQQATDPVVRQPKTVAETVKAGVPGLSESVQPRISRYGEPVVREGGWLRRAADPLNVSSAVDDPIDRELQRLGVRVTLPSDRLALQGGRTLMPEQETSVKQRRGRTVRRALEQLLADPRYARLNDAGRVRVIERLLPRVRERTSTAPRRDLSRVPGIIAPANRSAPTQPR